ncbi:glycosyltransferase family 2 protein [Staphylococcus sp. GDY8P120P]|uniref:glycosyltransferase family 2 protein n=1 Tax=Staphylococcus sp. GDY8P120P TaxID=2804156 RepID=UPI001AEBE054|nr:glycosyltransferase family 2 protein [Staphylococcus sp. GDY8P120P]
MIKVSFVVTVYNRENVIIRCLESLKNQTMNPKYFEIIIVDDCSNDQSLKNIKKFFKDNQWLNHKIIKLNKNTGNASIPRNFGINNSQGEYILFIDSDDYISKNTAFNSYEFAKNNDSDLVCLKMKAVGEGRNVPTAAYKNGNIKHADIIENSIIYTMSAQKLFKTSIIKEQCLQFSPKIDKGEDMLFMMEFIMNSNNISILADDDYYMLFTDTNDKKHLYAKRTSPKKYFSVCGEIFKAIYEGNKNISLETKHQIAGKYCTRIFRHGENNNFASNNDIDIIKKREWLYYFSHCLNFYLPKEADKYVTSIFNARLEAVRNNNLSSLILLENN